MWRVAVLLTCVACRFHFADVGGTPSDSTGGDGSGTVCVPQTEVCNGIDDDCDMQIDEGCPCTPFEITRPGRNPDSQPPAVWFGGGYALFYFDPSDNYVLERIDGTGASLGAPIPILAPGAAPAYPSAVYTGSSIALAMPRPPQTYFFDLAGNTVHAPQAIAGPNIDQGPNLAWNGSFVAIGYHDTATNSQCIDRYGPAGGYGGGVCGGLGDAMSSLAWYGSGFVVSEVSSPNPRFQEMATFDANGQFVSGPIALTGNRTGFRSGLTTGSAGVLGSVWVETSGFWIEPHTATGAALAPPTELEPQTTQTDASMSLVWTGTRYVAALSESNGTTMTVHLFQADATGQPIGAPEVLPATAPPSSIFPPLVRASAGRVVLTWSQTSSPFYELHVVQRCF